MKYLALMMKDPINWVLILLVVGMIGLFLYVFATSMSF
jgi:hypothetical protein